MSEPDTTRAEEGRRLAQERRRRAGLLFGALRRHRLKSVIALVVLVLLAIYAAYWLHYRAGHVTSKDARVQAQMIEVASRVDGWLRARPVIEGDPIHRGQILARLDKRDTRHQLAALQAELAADTAKVQQLLAEKEMTGQMAHAKVTDAKAGVAAAKAALAEAHHGESQAKTEYLRNDHLLKTHAGSQRQWDRAHSEYLLQQDAVAHARAELQARQSALVEARAGLGRIDVLTHQIAVERGERKAAMARANRLHQELTDRTLTSPINGVVDKTVLDAGDYVQAGQWILLIHDPQQLWIEANIKETKVGAVRVGQPVAIRVDAYPDLLLHGKVQRIGDSATSEFQLLPSPNPSGSFTKITQRVPVRIALSQQSPRLKPGLMSEISIDVSH